MSLLLRFEIAKSYGCIYRSNLLYPRSTRGKPARWVYKKARPPDQTLSRPAGGQAPMPLFANFSLPVRGKKG